MRVAGIERALCFLERLSGGLQDGVADRAADARRDDPRARQRGVAGVGGVRTGDQQQRLGAALTREHRLVPQVAVPCENALGLLIGVLGKVAEDQNDLVLDVQCGVAVVAEALTFRHDDAVAGEDDRAFRGSVVRERERLNVFPIAVSAGAERERRTSVARACGELERQPEIAASRQRSGANALQLRHDVVRCRSFAGRSGQAAVGLLRCEREDMRFGWAPARLGTRRGGDANRQRRDAGCRSGWMRSHERLLAFRGGAVFRASRAFS